MSRLHDVYQKYLIFLYHDNEDTIMQRVTVYSDEHVCVQQYNSQYNAMYHEFHAKNPSAFLYMQLGTGMRSKRVIRTQKHAVGYANKLCNHVPFITDLWYMYQRFKWPFFYLKTTTLSAFTGRQWLKCVEKEPSENSRDEISNYYIIEVLFLRNSTASFESRKYKFG